MADNSTTPVSDYLIKGKDYLGQQPGFKLVGRKEELNAAVDALMKKGPNNNLVLYSKGGTGLSSLVAGLQVGNEETGEAAPLADKNFYYLDVDALFSSGDSNEIKAGFQRAMKTLEQARNPVLVIENTHGFLGGVADNSSNNLINILMKATRNTNLQTVFMAGNGDVASLLKTHEDLEKNFSFQAVEEPSAEDLRPIIEQAAARLGESYDVAISPQAIDSVLELTKKYPLQGFSYQPKRSLLVLEGAITAALRTAQADAKAPGLAKLEETLAAVTTALESGKPAAGELADMSPDELAALREATESDIESVKEQWADWQEGIENALLEINDANEVIRQIDAAIEEQKAAEEKANKLRDDAVAKYKEAEGDPKRQQAIKDTYLEKTGISLVLPNEKDARSPFNSLTSSSAINALTTDRKAQKKVRDENEAVHKAILAEINAAREEAGENDKVSLTDTHVLAEFSRQSGIPVNKLNQDETLKILRIAETIKKRVFGQDEPAEALAGAVITAKAGLKEPHKPMGNFLFLGPSGVGKTEMAKALAEALFDDERALQTYSMSEFQEKQNISVLIGAAPGLEGNKDGGRLTNNMIAKPYCVNLFDEIEKAHKEIFDIFLQIFDEGQLTDTRNQTASFANALNIMTSNIGSEFFLDETLSFKEASKKALAKLKNPATGFRPEFLNRFNGIYCFNRLDNGQIVLIAMKNLSKLNALGAEKNISISMSEEQIKAMCEQQYDPATGGRGIQNYIGAKIRDNAGVAILSNPGVHGVVEVTYNPGKASAEDVAAIREEVENEGFFEIHQAVEKEFRSKIEFKYRGQEGAEQKIKADLDTKTKEKIEEAIVKKVKELEREEAVASTTFIPKDAETAATQQQTAANQNAARKPPKPAAG